MGAAKDRGYKRSWRNILLDKRYQLRFTLTMVVVSALLMVGLGLFVLDKAAQATDVARNKIDGIPCPEVPVAVAVEPAPSEAPEPGRPVVTIDDSEFEAPPRAPAGPTAAEIDAAAAARQACLDRQARDKEEIAARKILIGWVLAGSGLLLVVGLFLYGLKMTHKVAGPLHKVSLYMAKLEQGKYDTVYDLRKGDQLVEFYEHFKAAHAGLRRLQEEDRDRLKEVLAAADAADLASASPELAAALDELRAILAEKEESLG